VADIFTVGSGYLDINAALANTDLITVPAMSPTAVYDPATHLVSLSSNFSKVLGLDDSVVWGDTLFSGKVASGALAVWGADDSVVWGDSTNTAFTIIWGSTANLAFSITATSNDDWDQ